MHNMSAVLQEIICDTNKICCVNKGITYNPVHLKLYSTRIFSLTPCRYTWTDEDACRRLPRDIDRRIERHVLFFSVKENSIILAVSAGNVDISNLDSL